jgi:hypothetical protein
MTLIVRFGLAIALATWLALLSMPVFADTVWFKNGDRLSGEITSLEKGKLVVQSSYGGQLTLDWSAVSTLECHHPLIVRSLPDSVDALAKLQAARSGHVVLTDAAMKQEVPLANISQLRNPIQPGADWDWRGNADFGITITRSSSRLQNDHVSLDSKLIHDLWRHDINAAYEREADDASTNVNNYSLGYALDYFIGQYFYWQGRVKYRRDWVEELSRQYAYGTGPGYQFWDDELSAFSLTALLEQFNYLYSDNQEEQFYAAGLRWDFQRYIYGEQLQLYTRGDLERALNKNTLSLDADIGLRYKITKSTALNLSYGHDRVNRARENVYERRLTTGIGLVW